MYLKSLYPDVPKVPAQNVHHICFNRSDQIEWKNHTLHIEATTGKRRSFREFYERVIDGATALGSPISADGLGLNGEDGEIVGILGENSMDYIVLAHSLLAITTPFTMFSHYYTSFELARALQVSKATRIFVQPRYLSLVQKVAKDAGFPDDRIYTFDGQVTGRRSFDNMIQQVRKNSVPRIAVRPAGKDTLAYLVFSSGTTGLPKGICGQLKPFFYCTRVYREYAAVMISHGNIAYSMLQAVVTATEAEKVQTPPKYSTPEGFAVLLAFLPIHHTFGIHGLCFRAFLQQATQVLLSQWNIDIALKLIPKFANIFQC